MRIFRGRDERVVQRAGRRPGLDAVADGLLSTFLEAPDGHPVTLAAIAEERGLPARRLHAATRALIASGHLVRVKHEDRGGRWATDLFAFDTPLTAEELEAVRARHSDAVTVTVESAQTSEAQPTAPAERGTAPRRPAEPRVLPEDIELVTAASVRAVLDSLPGQLTALLPSPLPTAIQSAAEAALAAGRTPEDLCARVLRRWWAHGYAVKAASIQSPVGVAIALLRPGACPDPRCEDGVGLDTGTPCPRCAERSEDHHRIKAAERRAATGPTSPERHAAPTPTPPPYSSLDLVTAVDPDTNATGVARVRAALSAAKDARSRSLNLPINSMSRRPS
ncbi:hypothetical protein CIB93_30780 [Streptomyces sp. WZ.A104]|uniref:hypothetical protein n=1 Tax=Streptomyces sp. WZ.A104 TaxID=2023771 RepID=UPI000BBC6BF8|nr:hypothetical protein [Streptomyces sp. WZ.A104]PCG82295.1 hypothetical protein CIB93_30780 [Streptomyces sp. WZ.A104]